MTTTPLVNGYLDTLRATATDRLGRTRADELVEDIREHIDAAIASGQSPSEVLERLGSPAEIVGAEPSAGQQPTGPRLRPHEIFAIVLLLLGLPLLVIGWFIGLALLLTSDRWTTRDKLVGALVWPGGLGLFLAVGMLPGSVTTEECDSSGCNVVSTSGSTLPPWAGIVLAIVLVVPPIWTAIHLARSARVPSR